MNIYSFLAFGYDLLDALWFSDDGRNPRDVIEMLIPNEKCRVLDLCCGTFSTGLAVAEHNPNNLVIGLDRSGEMLSGAKRKVKREGLQNVKLICKDATKTGIKEETFDYIIIGLVLHECSPTLWKSILHEAGRLLKKTGN